VNFEDSERKSKEIRPDLASRSYLVAAGRLAPVKGFDILLNAFSMILNDYPNLDLIILGEGSQRASLTTQIRKLKLDTRVEMPGYVQNVYPYFLNAQVCIISSRLEGFPNVLLQMMSQNSRVVCTLSAGGIEKIPGLITCPPEDEAELEKAIRSSLKDTVDHRIEFSEYLSSRTWDSFYDEIMERLYT
jgi:glycosyltransferase involved in cell wall biosynthesis